MIRSRMFNTIPGATALSHPILYGVNILSVDRTRLGLTEISPLATPLNDEFKHFNTAILFDPTIPFNSGEQVQVIYQT